MRTPPLLLNPTGVTQDSPSPLTGMVQANMGVSCKKPHKNWRPYNPEEMIDNRKHPSYASAVAHRSVLVNEASAKFLAKRKMLPNKPEEGGVS